MLKATFDQKSSKICNFEIFILFIIIVLYLYIHYLYYFISNVPVYFKIPDKL